MVNLKYTKKKRPIHNFKLFAPTRSAMCTGSAYNNYKRSTNATHDAAHHRTTKQTARQPAKDWTVPSRSSCRGESRVARVARCKPTNPNGSLGPWMSRTAHTTPHIASQHRTYAIHSFASSAADSIVIYVHGWRAHVVRVPRVYVELLLCKRLHQLSARACFQPCSQQQHSIEPHAVLEVHINIAKGK